MDVFLSWSGEKSKAAAVAMREWLPKVIQQLRPWVSKGDIGAGARWGQEIQKQLAATRFGILVTRSNAKKPWLNFEAGAIAKTIDATFVCPYLLDFDNAAELPDGPLTQFQAMLCHHDDTLHLLRTINSSLDEEHRLADSQLDETFNVWWPRLEATLQKLPNDDEDEPRRNTDEMIEESLLILRRLERSVGEIPSFGGKQSAISNVVDHMTGQHPLYGATITEPIGPPSEENLTRVVQSPSGDM